MITIEVEIRGDAPLLQNRFGEAAQQSGKGTRAVHVRNEDPRAQAEESAYRTPDKKLYHPGASISRMLREAGSSHKQKGSRKSLKYIIPAAVRLKEDAMILLDGKGKPLKDFEVDSRPVTIPATKGRIMRHRPRHDTWKICFSLVINEDVLAPETIQMLLTEGGQRIGIGDFRPEKGGPFGIFQVTKWEPLKD
jgi:hypothetical protein